MALVKNEFFTICVKLMYMEQIRILCIPTSDSKFTKLKNSCAAYIII